MNNSIIRFLFCPSPFVFSFLIIPFYQITWPKNLLHIFFLSVALYTLIFKHLQYSKKLFNQLLESWSPQTFSLLRISWRTWICIYIYLYTHINTDRHESGLHSDDHSINFIWRMRQKYSKLVQIQCIVFTGQFEIWQMNNVKITTVLFDKNNYINISVYKEE